MRTGAADQPLGTPLLPTFSFGLGPLSSELSRLAMEVSFHPLSATSNAHPLLSIPALTIRAFPQGDEGLAVSFEIYPEMLKEANLERLEHVTVTMNVEHTRRGELTVDLVSPDKVVSHLAETRRLDTGSSGYNDWTFMSVVHW